MVHVKALISTSPAREGEPVGTADTSRLDYTRWQYDDDTEREANTAVLYYVECDTQRLTLAFV